MTDMLRLEGVRKVYKTDVRKKPQVAIDDLTLVFPRGATTGLLGHNGAGKTTTIRMILGLVKPDKGRVLFDGVPLSNEAKRRIGYMPEVNKLPTALTPDEILSSHVALFAPAHLGTRELRDAAIDQALASVEMTRHRKKRLGKMSKGMARRVAWAQATIHKPSLLILDEPSSGLDPLARREMLGWIADERGRGTTIVLCTHELAQVHTLCDGFHVLNKGKLVHSTLGAAGEQARERYGLALSGADSAKLERLERERRLPKPAAVALDGFVANVTIDGYSAATQWLGAAIDAGLVVLRFGEHGYAREDELIAHFRIEEAP